MDASYLFDDGQYFAEAFTAVLTHALAQRSAAVMTADPTDASAATLETVPHMFAAFLTAAARQHLPALIRTTVAAGTAVRMAYTTAAPFVAAANPVHAEAFKAVRTLHLIEGPVEDFAGRVVDVTGDIHRRLELEINYRPDHPRADVCQVAC